MNKIKSFSLLLAVILTLAVSCNPVNKESFAGSKPNIVFILADDLGWADLPVYGNSFNEAPNLTRMAESGLRFTNAYAACPVCSPTRASIMSGQYPARVGIIDFIPGHWRPYEEVTVPSNRTQYLPSEIYTLGEAMKDAGYATGYFGKWHLGNANGFGPANQGFDVSNVYRGGGFYDYPDVMIPPIEVEPGTILSEALTDLSLDFMDNHKDKPFFLFLAHYDVHVQLDADSVLIQKFLSKEKTEGYPCNAVYAAMIEHLDNSVGRIIDKLEELELSENTIVIFFSDNGGLVSRYDLIPLIAQPKQYIYENDTLLYVASSNDPLKAEKGTIYEGGIREPMIVRWPGKIKPGTVSDVPVTSVDFFPTLAELSGTELPSTQVFDGESLVPLLQGEIVNEERPVFWHYPVYHHDRPASAVRKGNWKLIHYLDDDSRLLFNLEDDIGETSNLMDQNPEKANELFNLLETWRKDVKAELPVANPDFDSEKRYEWGVHPDRKNR